MRDLKTFAIEIVASHLESLTILKVPIEVDRNEYKMVIVSTEEDTDTLVIIFGALANEDIDLTEYSLHSKCDQGKYLDDEYTWTMTITFIEVLN